MKQRHEILDYLHDIVDAIEKVEKFIKGMKFEEFKNDDKTIFAVIRALEIIGEASKKIPNSERKKYLSIPWKEIAGMRDKLIHEYFGVNLSVVYKTTKEDIPPLLPLFMKIIDDINKRIKEEA